MKCYECDRECDNGYYMADCQSCNGSGEGHYSGSICRECGGDGEISMECDDKEENDEIYIDGVEAAPIPFITSLHKHSRGGAYWREAFEMKYIRATSPNIHPHTNFVWGYDLLTEYHVISTNAESADPPWSKAKAGNQTTMLRSMKG